MPNHQATQASNKQGVWTFYLVFLVCLVGEGVIVHFIVTVASHFGAHQGAPWIAWLLFVIFGAGLASYELHVIDPETEIRDPLLKFSLWLVREGGILGYATASALIGPLSVGVALKHLGHPNKSILAPASAILFASVWVPLFVLVWR